MLAYHLSSSYLIPISPNLILLLCLTHHSFAKVQLCYIPKRPLRYSVKGWPTETYRNHLTAPAQIPTLQPHFGTRPVKLMGS